MKKLLLTILLVFIALPAYAADEVVISERGNQLYATNGAIQPIHGKRITTQIEDVGTLSSAFSAETSMIEICANGAAIWYKIGASGVSAAANTDGNEILFANTCRDEPLEATDTHIDTAADS